MTYTFLILEDDIEVQDDLRNTIISMNCQNKTLMADNVDDALKILEDYSIDAAFVDIHVLGEKTGWQFIKEIRKTNELMPIAVISSTASINDMLDGFNKYNMIAGIDKPYTEESIKAAINKTIALLEHIDDEVIALKGYGRVTKLYKGKDIYCVERRNSSRSVVVTAYDCDTRELVETEFPLRGSIIEIANKFTRKKTLIRCHQSFLVNPRYIDGIDWRNDELILTNGKKLAMGGENYIQYLEPFIK